jgi:LemA protein
MTFEFAAGFVVVIVMILSIIVVVTVYNAVIGLGQRIDKAWANIDVALKQRHDELPRLVDAVRGVMAFEREVLEEVTRLRSAYRADAPIPEQGATSMATSGAIRALFAVMERYPDVRSQANVAALQDEIRRLEDIISDRRELYNDMTYRYNTRIAQLPAVFLAKALGWRARPFFTVPAAEAIASPARM